MKVLSFILKRMSNKRLAELLLIHRANITLWKKNKAVPRKHVYKIKEIKNELTSKGK